MRDFRKRRNITVRAGKSYLAARAGLAQDQRGVAEAR